ncbi:trehalose-phosphatase activity protein [[Candida] boidinii]|nr:trehalose-phosphatase activity protein [[Candida] boidinii]
MSGDKENIEEAIASPFSNPEFDPNVIKAKNPHLKLSGRIINAMSQLPHQIYKKNENEWDVKRLRGNSALYSSNSFLDQQTKWETHLVAWTGELLTQIDDPIPRSIPHGTRIENDPLYLSETDKEDVTEKIRKASNSDNVHPVWLLRKDQDRWRKYAENVLWPIFHYMQFQPSDGRQEAEWWYDYVKFNESYASKIKEIYKDGDIIWIHDYYLLLLPQLLRMELPNAHIGVFFHTPFPSSEYFRCLSKRKYILDGILGANLIGFQSYSFSRHFISCCARLLGYEVTPDSVHVHSSVAKVVSYPIGIDTIKIEHDAFGPNIDAKMKSLKELSGFRKIIIGRDRLDTVRGVVQKLQAFDMFLDMYPEWRDKVVLIQVSFKSHYHSKKLDKEVSEIISNVNGKYGTFDYSPIQHYQMRIEKDEYLALLRVADLCLLTPVRDGMNTTALEYIICQKESSSPLIISEFSGSTTVIPDSIQVNPWDSVGVSNAINEALLLPDVRKKDLEHRLYASVSKNTIQDWTINYLQELINTVSDNDSLQSTPYLNRPLLFRNYETAKKRLFLFDYDGTLTPIVRDPSAAIPSSRLLDLLSRLIQDKKNEIWIISGRDQDFLEKWIGSKFKNNVGLSAEHGCFMKLTHHGDNDNDDENKGNEVTNNSNHNDTKKDWINLAETFDMSWQKEVEEIFGYYTERTPGSFIEKKKVAVTWHYRKSDPDFGIFQAAKCKDHLINTVAKKYQVEVMTGKANLEVRPNFVNKGEIVKRLVLARNPVESTTNNNNLRNFEELPDFILCLGDDTTDEDMFKSLNKVESDLINDNRETNEFKNYGIYPVTVGPANKETAAKAYLSDPSQVLDTLGLLVGQVSLFETGGSVELDDRGHLLNGESSMISQANRKAYQKAREQS